MATGLLAFGRGIMHIDGHVGSQPAARRVEHADEPAAGGLDGQVNRVVVEHRPCRDVDHADRRVVEERKRGPAAGVDDEDAMFCGRMSGTTKRRVPLDADIVKLMRRIWIVEWPPRFTRAANGTDEDREELGGLKAPKAPGVVRPLAECFCCG